MLLNELISLNRDTASVAQLCEHLQSCDKNFSPPLSSRVEIPYYANKLHKSAARYEAWSGYTLIGLVAVYQNAPDSRSAFISNVSVVKLWQGRGIAGQLLDLCIEEATKLKFTEIALDVSKSQPIAVSMYEKRGFRAQRTTSGMLKMHLTLNR